jgi:glyoxylase-like metal-dependent hydrolase (beta-lactamase superfamily II)
MRTSPHGALFPALKACIWMKRALPEFAMHVHVLPIGPLETNCYLLEADGEAVIVDPGGNPYALLRYLEEHELTLTRILITHMHFDHILGNADLAKATGARIYADKRDEPLLEVTSGTRFGLQPTPPFAYDNLEEGDLTLLGQPCKVIATPGHSPGSLSYYFPDASAVFVGDVLFYRSVGRTDLPGGDAGVLGHSIRKKIYALPADTVVYPGHGPATTVGEEMRENPFFRG